MIQVEVKDRIGSEAFDKVLIKKLVQTAASAFETKTGVMLLFAHASGVPKQSSFLSLFMYINGDNKLIPICNFTNSNLSIRLKFPLAGGLKVRFLAKGDGFITITGAFVSKDIENINTSSRELKANASIMATENVRESQNEKTLETSNITANKLNKNDPFMPTDNKLTSEGEQKMQDLLTGRGLKVYEIPGDGHCLYNAISHQLKNLKLEYNFKQLRFEAAAFMRYHPEDYMPFLSTDKGEKLTLRQFNSYCFVVSNTNVWGDQTEISALARVFDILIEVIHASGEIYTFGNRDQPGKSIISIVYNGVNHFNSVVLE